MTDSEFPRFGGIARLYGQPALDRFHTARVAVIGIGGVGSWAVESLARSGIGHLTLVDLDEICLSNVNRQLHAMDGQIGRQKTHAMAERVRAIHPDGEMTVLEQFFTERSAASILDPGFDAVIDAIDHTYVAQGVATGGVPPPRHSHDHLWGGRRAARSDADPR